MRFFGLKSAVLGLAVLLADFVSKTLTYHFIPKTPSYALWYPYNGIGIFKNFLGIEFSINHTTNTGMAWGLFAAHPEYLFIARALLIAGLLLYFLFFNKEPKYDLPLTMIIAGAIGNVVDYLIYGHVIDMLHFVLWGYDFPVFNLADSAIFIGVCWIFLATLVEKTKKKAFRTAS